MYKVIDSSTWMLLTGGLLMSLSCLSNNESSSSVKIRAPHSITASQEQAQNNN